MIPVVLDYESRSRVSLKHTNAYKYARHESTEVLCAAYQIGDGDVELWLPGEPFPFAAIWDQVVIDSFNAGFELAIWNYCCVRKYGWPRLAPEDIFCNMATSYFSGLPRGGLGDVCDALGLAGGKDTEGNKVMKRLCRPQKIKGTKTPKLIDGVFHGGGFDETPAKHERNYIYCINDVAAEAVVSRLSPPLTPFERRLWLANEAINRRGVPVDMAMCRNAVQLVDWEIERLSKEFSSFVEGRTRAGNMGPADSPDCLDRFKDWLKTQGFNMPDLQEATLNEALDGKLGEMPPQVKRALMIRKIYKDKAVTKYRAAINHANEDHRCQGAHIYYKAGPGRFQGAGVNFLNLRRLNEDKEDENVALADQISEADADKFIGIYDRLQATDKGVIPTLGSIVRMMVCAPPGKKLVVCDYSSIEMRKLHWMAGDEPTLKLIRDFDNGVGEELYRIYAAAMLNKLVKDITKEERNRGKVLVLGCGYLQGAEKFVAFCKNYGIDMPLDKAQELVQFYRRSFPLVKKFWYALQKAAVTAIKKQRPTQCGVIDFYMRGHSLIARLPSGREMKYYDASVVEGDFGPEVEALDQRNGKRKAVALPTLVENMVQGSSRDLLADALVKCHDEKLPVVLHVYDEIVIEVDEDDDETPARLQEIMIQPPSWADGLPVAAEPKSSRRYTK